MSEKGGRKFFVALFVIFRYGKFSACARSAVFQRRRTDWGRNLACHFGSFFLVRLHDPQGISEFLKYPFAFNQGVGYLFYLFFSSVEFFCLVPVVKILILLRDFISLVVILFLFSLF